MNIYPNHHAGTDAKGGYLSSYNIGSTLVRAPPCSLIPVPQKEVISLLNSSQQARLARVASGALARSFAAFPNMLGNCESEEAARIVADLLKAQMHLPEAPSDPAAELGVVLERIAQMEDSDSAA